MIFFKRKHQNFGSAMSSGNIEVVIKRSVWQQSTKASEIQF